MQRSSTPGGSERRHLDQLNGLMLGVFAGHAVSAAIELGLPDALGDRTRTAADMAELVDGQVDRLTRLLRGLTATGVLAEVQPGHFRLTGVGHLLRTNQPSSRDCHFRMYTEPHVIASWSALAGCVRTGTTAFDSVYGTDFFSYLADHPELSGRFNMAMRQITEPTADAVTGSFDFGRFGVIADIGGGDGTLLASVLATHPGLRGILFDTPNGLARGPEILRAAGVEHRVDVQDGDFFAAIPEGADLYLLKGILHDWDDDQAIDILRLCRTNMGPHGRLIIIEPVVPDTVATRNNPKLYLADLNMMILLGGRVRTASDFEKLLAGARMRLEQITQLPSPSELFSIIEVAPVSSP